MRPAGPPRGYPTWHNRPPPRREQPKRRLDGSRRCPSVTSTGRPFEGSPAHQVDVEVIHRLATPATDVRDQPVPAIGDAGTPGQISGDREQPPEHRPGGGG